MALSKDYVETKPGLSGQLICDNAYWRVEQVIFSKAEAVATVIAYDAPGGVIVLNRMVSFDPDIEGPNPIKQAYIHLKTLPEFSGAVDC